MSPRYLLVVAEDSRGRFDFLDQLSKRCQLDLVFSNGQFVALANSACRCVPIGNEGCILGSLFHRHGLARAVSSLSESEATAIVSSDGQLLLSAFWGGYFAVIAGPDRSRALRDPSGNFPCYYATIVGIKVFASDAELLVEAGFKVEVEFEAIGRQLYRAFVPEASTALSGIRELLAGFAMTLPGEMQEAIWSPWDFVSGRNEPREECKASLLRVIEHAVLAWGSTRGRVLLSVSGGLDSSIIASSLARAGIETICLTMFTDDPAGDERTFARSLCDHIGLLLVEWPYRLEDIDISQPLAAHLPRPRDRTQANAFERVHLEVASEIGADVFMTGNGGDHVLGYSQTAAPIVDKYLTEGVSPGLLGALLDVCQQTGCSLTDAVRHAWRLGSRSPPYRVRPNPLFLHPKLVARLNRSAIDHPWLNAPTGALPGSAEHIASILRVQPILETSRRNALPVFNPLVSQPIVETCLSIPSWEWRKGGRDRSLAREAFAKDLPPIVLNRRIKGTPSRFAARLLDHFRGPIRERLLGGRLAAREIVDAVALEQMLAGERPVPDRERVRILELVNAEAWIDHWIARNEAFEPVELNIRSRADARPPL